MYKSVKMRGTPRQFMYANWDPTIIVGSHLHKTSIQLHNVYFIFRLLKGWYLGHYFLNKSYSSSTHTPFFWTHFTTSLLALLSILCIGTAELHVDLERSPHRCNISRLFHSGCGPQVQELKRIML